MTRQTNRTYIASRLRSPSRLIREWNVAIAAMAARQVVESNPSAWPFVPHLLYPQFMNPAAGSPEDLRAIEWAINELGTCQTLAVFWDSRGISDGMAAEIRLFAGSPEGLERKIATGQIQGWRLTDYFEAGLKIILKHESDSMAYSKPDDVYGSVKCVNGEFIEFNGLHRIEIKGRGGWRVPFERVEPKEAHLMMGIKLGVTP